MLLGISLHPRGNFGKLLDHSRRFKRVILHIEQRKFDFLLPVLPRIAVVTGLYSWRTRI